MNTKKQIRTYSAANPVKKQSLKSILLDPHVADAITANREPILVVAMMLIMVVAVLVLF